MTDTAHETISRLFEPVRNFEIEEKNQFNTQNRLLAHYTTLETLESILKNDQIWFSSPLLMNDLEEVRWGMLTGVAQITRSDQLLRVLGGEERHNVFVHALDHFLTDFDEKHLFDTYVFCLSEHNQDNQDGLLSMWRGYGGNGRGAAIVIDTSKIEAVDESPFLIAKVHYGSYEKRVNWLDKLIELMVGILSQNFVSDRHLYLAARAYFERIKLFAFFSKHDGFSEESEWRIVYFSDRDSQKKLRSMLSYENGPRGVEPKLKFDLGPSEGVSGPNLSLEYITSDILLGPSTSGLLAFKSIERMLDGINKSSLKAALRVSTIPYRPLSNK